MPLPSVMPISLLLLVSLMMGICIAAPVHAQTTYPLTVTGGYGSGSYRVGDTVHIWAKALPTDSAFVAWRTVAGTAAVADTAEWHTTLIMPASALSLRAHFAPPPAWTATEEQIQDRDDL